MYKVGDRVLVTWTTVTWDGIITHLLPDDKYAVDIYDYVTDRLLNKGDIVTDNIIQHDTRY